MVMTPLMAILDWTIRTRRCRIARFLFDEEMPNETRPHQ
jgi:hypothetical protein